MGGGPAGSVAARCLASWGRRVALFERSRYGGRRYGETLPPETAPLLVSLGLRGDLAGVESIDSSGTVSSWGDATPVESDFVRNVHGPGVHVDRVAFDRALAGAARLAGATLLTGVAARAVEPVTGGWCVSTDAGPVHARFVVDAAGGAGRVVQRPRGTSRDRLLALTTLLRHRAARPPDLRTYVEATPRGWWYSAPVRERETVAMFFTDRVEYSRGVVLADQLEHAPLTGGRVASTDVVEARVLDVRSALRDPVGGERWVVVGDSAATYDPVSGMGVYKAVGDAAVAAAAVHRALDGDAAGLARYAERVRAAFEGYSRTRALTYAAEQRWRGGGFWDRRTAAS